MTSETEKVLRRACARFKTGIRRPFQFDGETASFETAGHYLDPDADADDGEESMWCEAYLVIQGRPVNALDGTRPVLRIPLSSVSPEVVWTAYLQSQVDAVHAL